MEAYDSQMARRVWQRVQGAPEPVGALIAGEAQSAALCGKLAQMLPAYRQRFHKMAEQCRQNMRILRGIAYFTAGAFPKEVPLKPQQERLQGLLRKCYLQALKIRGEYVMREADPEYGPVFSALAQQKQQCCAEILEILGGEAAEKMLAR